MLDPDWPLVSAAAKIKARGGLSYADAFCIATAVRVEAPLWTGDPEIVELGATFLRGRRPAGLGELSQLAHRRT